MPFSSKSSSGVSEGSASAGTVVSSVGTVVSSAGASSVEAAVSSVGTSVVSSTVDMFSWVCSSAVSAQAGVTSWKVMVRAMSSANSFFIASPSFFVPYSPYGIVLMDSIIVSQPAAKSNKLSA